MWFGGARETHWSHYCVTPSKNKELSNLPAHIKYWRLKILALILEKLSTGHMMDLAIIKSNLTDQVDRDEEHENLLIKGQSDLKNLEK